MAVHPDEIKRLIIQAIPDAEVEVRCYSGDDHFEAEVVSPAFAGKTKVAQHKMVYAALGDRMRSAIHALSLNTHT